jgi:adenosylcobinamide-phosphate synthase
MAPETFPILVIALLIDALFGYPGILLRASGHPVMWMGTLIDLADRQLNKEHWPSLYRKLAGTLAMICVTTAAVAIGAIVQIVASTLPYGFVLISLAASTLLASRSLFVHVRNVETALQEGLEAGRRAVSQIVGRDPESLDIHGVARAAIESLAENASDGVVAPAFWFAALGLPGLAAYKAINTADSMIAHHTPRHEAFGWAAARLDDLVNLPASRLTALFFALAAFFHGASAWKAVKAVITDANRHRSPNAGWPEAAMAGALGLRLAGPRSYGGVLVEDAYMGDGNRDATAGDIRRALTLAKLGWLIMFAATVVLATITARS